MAQFLTAIDTISPNQLEPAIDRVFDLAEALDAYRHLQKANHIGKVVIRIGDS